MSPISRTGAAIGLTAVLAMGATLPAHADTAPTPAPATSTAPTSTPSEPTDLTGPRKDRLERRAERLCARLPKVEARIGRVIARLSGDAGTRGSVQWLQAKAGQVRAKDPALADLLDSRARIRQARLPVLKLRQQELPKVTAWCDAHNHPAGE